MNSCVCFSTNILKLFYSRIKDTDFSHVKLDLQCCYLGKNYFFYCFLQQLHELVGENANRRQERSAVEELGSQGWQQASPEHELYLQDPVPRLLMGQAGLEWVADSARQGLILPGWVSGVAKDVGRHSCSLAQTKV